MFFCVLSLVLLCTPLASEDDFQDAVSYFTGAFDEASFSESEFEHFSRLREHPLRLNYASRSALIASGLFTAYQVESLLDYRRRNGAVLSLAELGVVDGFNASTVKHYALFLDFGTDASDIFANGDRAFPAVDSLKLRHLRRIIDADVLCGASGKIAEGKASLRWYAKLLASYRGAVGKWQVSAASRQNWAYTPATSGTASRSALPRAVASDSGASRGIASGVSRGSWEGSTPDWSFSLSYSGGDATAYRTNDSRFSIQNIIVGNFSARFGQGLLQWSGVRFENVSSPSALMLRSYGLRPYTSYSQDYSLFGAAARMDIGRLSVSPFVNIGDPLHLAEVARNAKVGGTVLDEMKALGCAGLNVGWSHHNGQVGATLLFPFDNARRTALSVDFQHTVRSFVLFGETAADLVGGISALGGLRFIVGAFDFGLRFCWASFLPELARHGAAASTTGASSYLWPESAIASVATSPHEIAASLAWQSDRYEHKIAVSPSFAYYSRASGRTPFASAQGKISLIYDAQVATLWKFKTRLLYKERFLTRKADPSAKYASAWTSQRLDLRQDLRWDNGVWRFGGRFDLVAGDYLFRGPATPSDLPLSLLCGVEGAWKHPSPAISLHFQSAVFAIDRWNERVWYYCNDAPSNFNVLQMYGRGYYLGLYAKATFLSSLTIYLRADFTAYPWARSDDTRRLSSLSGRVQLCYFF